MRAHRSLKVRAWLSLAGLAVVMGVMIFGTAGTLDYPQAWVYLLLFFGLSAAITFDLMRHDPALLERRMKGGPQAERRPLQRVTTGPYAIVRHPMYASGSLYLVGTPLALGSYWGLLAVAGMLPFLILRLLDEERLLVRELPGYADYQRKVRFRIVPGIW